MIEYIFLVHDDTIADEKGWERHVRALQQDGFFEGGSATGQGLYVPKTERHRRSPLT